MTHVIKIHSDCIFLSLTTLMNLHFVFSQCIYSCFSFCMQKQPPPKKSPITLLLYFLSFFLLPLPFVCFCRVCLFAGYVATLRPTVEIS